MIGWLTILFLLLASPAWAQNIWYVKAAGPSTTGPADSCTHAHVVAAIAAAVPGETVQVGAGSCTWTGFTISGITLLGAGYTLTHITDGAAATSQVGLIQISNTTGSFTRVSGFEFIGGATRNALSRVIQSGGAAGGPSWRVDHNKFNQVKAQAIGEAGPSAYSFGVIDNNIFIVVGGYFSFELNPARWPFGTSTVANGDGSWASASTLGLATSGWYIEDNTFTTVSPAVNTILMDGQNGARYVWRYNNVSDGVLASHGTETPNRQRGMRQYEIYGNTWTKSGPGTHMANIRSGTGMIWGNTITGTYTSLGTLNNFRSWEPHYQWGQCGAQSSWDVNIGGIHESGTHTGADGATILQDTTKTWTTDQWEGYTVKNLATGRSSAIDENTANTLEPHPGVAPFVSPTAMVFNFGNSYEIRRAYPCMDMIGWTGGSLVTGTPPVVPSGWNNQTLEPLYSWDNSGYTLFSQASQVQSGREFYNGIVGSGLRSARPATCTLNDAYWSTDFGGNWHTTNGTANDGTLDKCTATNTWTNAFYTPYTYPHPITLLGGNPPVIPAAPTGFQIAP